MDPTIWLISIVTILVIYYLLTRGDNSYPPGPFVFPFIGNLPQLLMIGEISKFAEHYKRRYGNVFSIEFGGARRVVISGYDTIHNLLVKNADFTSNRTVASFSAYQKKDLAESPGFMWAPHPQWKTLRSLAISTLREQGMGKSSLEVKIMEEVELYIEHFLKPNLGKPFSVTHNLNQAASNIISQMIFGRRFSYNDEEFTTVVAAIDEILVVAAKVGLIESVPFGSHLIKAEIEKEKHVTDSVLKPILGSYIEETKEALDRENPRSVFDRYIMHSENVKGTEKKFYSDKNGVTVAIQLFGAGTETTSTSIRWALLYMCLYPEIKEKVQREIDDVVGSSRPVTCKDRVNMPYTDAVLYETLRKANVAHIALPHTADRELMVDGVQIPTGADLMLNMASVLSDEAVFEEPEKFKPERYLTGDIVLKKQRTIPFGIGRRACPGESLARMEYFIFFVTFLQRFNISLPDGVTMTDDADPKSGVIRCPLPYELIFTNRN